jgi:hypothetical protein
MVPGPAFEVVGELSDDLQRRFSARFHCLVCQAGTTVVVRLCSSPFAASRKNAHRKNKVQDDRTLSVAE